MLESSFTLVLIWEMEKKQIIWYKKIFPITIIQLVLNSLQVR